MIRNRKYPRPIARDPAYRQAFERLDETLEQNSEFSNADKIQLLGRTMFGEDWDDPEETCTLKIPE
jgi:tetrahydromethanopterin S-methyltransferase subunit G